MSLGLLKVIPREYLPAPRVDGTSLSLQNSINPGEAQEAKINDVALTNLTIVRWDTVNKRLASTLTTETELLVLHGITPGTVALSKAVIVDASKDIAGFRYLSATKLTSTEDIESGRDLTVTRNATITGVFTANGDIKLAGLCKVNHIRLNENIKLQYRYSNVDYDAISQYMSTLVVGNSAVTDLFLQTGTSRNVYHRIGTDTYKIWDENNHGTGSGLDADKLDGQHGTYYRSASNINAGTLAFDRLPVAVQNVQVNGVTYLADLTTLCDVVYLTYNTGSYYLTNIKLNGAQMTNGKRLLLINNSATVLYLRYNNYNYNGINSFRKGSDFTEPEMYTEHVGLQRYEMATIVKYADDRWYVEEVYEIKKTAFNKNFGTSVGNIPTFAESCAGSGIKPVLMSNGGLKLADGTLIERVPSTWDFSRASLTIDASYHDMDLSSILPTGATVALLHVELVPKSAVGHASILFRKYGSSWDSGGVTSEYRDVNSISYGNILVKVSAGRLIQYTLENFDPLLCNIVVMGWMY